MLAAIAVCAIINLLLYAVVLVRGVAAPWIPWLFACSAVTMLSALMMLGARRAGTAGRTTPWAIGVVAVLVLAGFAVALQHPSVSAQTPLVLGLPPASAVIIYGVGLLPLAILPLAYAVTFDRAILSADDLQRVKDAAQPTSTDHVRSDPSA